MRVLVLGAGICGLGTALLLARDGHDVIVVERDAGDVPDSPLEAWGAWSRRGVAQFRQPHNFMPGLRLLLERELPDVQDALRRAGASRFDLVHPLPPSFADRSPRPIDDQLWTLTARRPVGEWVFAQAALSEPRVSIRRGTPIVELLTGEAAVPGIPHVTGVRTESGERVLADIVVDATGRQSRAAEWLAAIGARPPAEEQEDSGFAYYTRYFSGTVPERAGPALMHLDTISLLTLPGDNGTWSVTVFAAGGDQPLKELRHEDKWTKVVRACPLQAHWLDGEPMTPVLTMAGIVDRIRRLAADDSPVVTGFVAVADAWACTNPSAGRGLTVGFLHARLLRDVLDETRGGAGRFEREFAARTEADIAPWYYAQRAVDRARYADLEAVRAGRERTPPSDELARSIGSLFVAMPASPDLFRAALEYVGTITPVQRILGRPDVVEGIRAAMSALKNAPPPRMPGPNRAQVLELLG